jgi:hypothetical protein
LQHGQDFVTVAGSMLVFKILSILLFSGIIMMAFRLFGGTGNYENTLCAYLYIVSPLYLFLLLLYILNIGIFSTYDENMAINWQAGDGLTHEQIMNYVDVVPIMAIITFFIWLLEILSPIVWFLVCWGAFRAIHQVLLVRSTLSFLLTLLIWPFFLMLNIFIIKGLYKGSMPLLQ